MIILELGNREYWWSGIKFQCHHCHANLELEDKDVPVVYWPTQGFFSHCPLCAATNCIGERPEVSEEIEAQK